MMLTVLYYDGNQNRFLRTKDYATPHELADFITSAGHDVTIVIEGNPSIYLLDLDSGDLDEYPSSSTSD